MSDIEPARFHPVACVLASLFPGAGHMYHGERARGLLAAGGILGLFLGGLLLGGLTIVDSREERMWFIPQACVGPMAFAIDYYHQNAVKVRDIDPMGRPILRDPYPNEGRGPDAMPIPNATPPVRKAVTKMSELGTLSAALAGMVNLIVIIDAGWPSRRRQEGGA